jgi:hypothetical protein
MNQISNTQPEPFHHKTWTSVDEAWADGLNEEYWRWGITISQGLGWNVSEETLMNRLNYIRCGLGRALFGNNWRRRACRISFLVFRHGSMQSFDQHFHAVMAIEGDHGWSDEQVAKEITAIELKRKRFHWEKLAYVDFDWREGNRFHKYIRREMSFDGSSYFAM